MAAPPDILERVLGEIRTALPSVNRVGIYADARAILEHGAEQLRRFRDLGLGIVYFGPETGDAVTLKAVRKGTTVARQLEAFKGARIRPDNTLLMPV